MRRLRLLACLATVLPVAGAALPAAARPQRPARQVVAAGYDLFHTPDGSRVGVDLAGLAGVPLVTFRGTPLGEVGFGRHGRHDVGAADTVVRRLDAATPARPRVRIELVALLLESSNVPGWYVTLQSARTETDVPGSALGLPSTGTLDIAFDGTLASELLVNYDVRQGAPDGPIVASGTTGMGFVAEGVVWQHTRAGAACPVGPCLNLEAIDKLGPICHDTPPPIQHQHCVGGETDRIPLLPGVNHLLNGSDTSADFHPLGTPPA